MAETLPTADRISLLPPRFASFVVAGENGCWNWTGQSVRGYGKFWLDGRNRIAHRVAYELMVGPIPKPTLDHLCRNRACVNPDHLEPATPRENTLRGESVSAVNARKTACKNGHAFSPENTYRRSDGERECKECRRARQRRSARRTGTDR